MNYAANELNMSSSLQVSPLPKNRSPLSSNGGGGASFARWSMAASAGSNGGSRPCQNYENLDFLYRNPPTNSAPSGVSVPPPLPAKSIQRGELQGLKMVLEFISVTVPQPPPPLAGRSDPQISLTSQEPGTLPRRCSNPPSHSSSPQTQARHGASSPNADTLGARAPRSPHGQGGVLRKQTWEGPPGPSQTHIGPVRYQYIFNPSHRPETHR